MQLTLQKIKDVGLDFKRFVKMDFKNVHKFLIENLGHAEK